MTSPCPKCGSGDCYVSKTRRKLRCKACGADYSTTSGTPFASTKLSDQKRTLLTDTITLNPTMPSQKIADLCGTSQKTAWLWKIRLLAPDGGATKGYYQKTRKLRGMTRAVWKIRHVDPWPARRQSAFLSMWKRGCPIKCMAAMFGVEPGTISCRVSRYDLPRRSA